MGAEDLHAWQVSLKSTQLHTPTGRAGPHLVGGDPGLAQAFLCSLQSLRSQQVLQH
jgi:hypothetical protein